MSGKLSQTFQIYLTAFSVFAAIIFAVNASFAQTPDFAGRTIELYAPGSAGSGTDAYARTLAPYLAKHLPGSPTIIVRNIPGASTIGANQFQQNAEPDGLSLIAMSVSTVLSYALRDERVQYDLPSWPPILVSPQGTFALLSTSLGIEGPQDLPELNGGVEIVYGGSSPTASELRFLLAFDMLGWNLRPVWGMDRGPARLAFERGETSVTLEAAPGFLQSGTYLVTEGKGIPIFSTGVLDNDGNIVRDPLFPDLPTFPEAYEIVHGEKPAGVEYDTWFQLFKQGTMLNKYLALPTGTPEPIVEAYRTAVQRMLDDPEAAERIAGLLEGYDPIVGAAGESIVQTGVELSPEAFEFLSGWLKEKYDVTLNKS